MATAIDAPVFATPFAALSGLAEQLAWTSAPAAALGLPARARLLASPEVATPQVLGALRPAVLLPEEQLARLTPGDLALTLCHELLHVRRGDLWLGWVPALAERLFFFHPLVRLAVREYALAREAACDAEVLRVLAPPPEDYGRLLVKLGVTPRASRLAAAAPSFRTLKRRLEMLQQSTETKRLHPAVWCLVGLAAVAGLVPFRMVAQPEAAQIARLADRPAAHRNHWSSNKKLAVEAERKLKALIDQAVASGKAQPAG